MDRFLKKGKPFLDEKLKPKQRFKALQTALEGMSDEDQAKFFQDHDYSAYTVMYDVVFHKSAKLKERTDRPGNLIANKDATDLFEALAILRKILIHCKAKLKQGWQMRSILGLLESLLIPGNHEQLRKEGFSLLLLYSCEKEQDMRDLVELYASSINLNVFQSFPLPQPVTIALSDCVQPQETGILVQYRRHHFQEYETPTVPVMGKLNEPLSAVGKRLGFSVPLGSGVDQDGSNAVIPSNPTFEKGPIIAGGAPTALSEAQLLGDLLVFLEEVAMDLAITLVGTDLTEKKLSNILFGDQGIRIRNTWSMFKSHYLRFLFPVVSKKISLSLDNNEGFPTCPPILLEQLLSFLVTNCSQKPTLNGPSPAKNICFSLLQILLLNDEKNRELVNEMIRQAMLLPVEHSIVTRQALYLLGSWIIVPPGDRLPFLNTEVSSHPDAIGEDDTSPRAGPYVDTFLARCIAYTKLVFLDRDVSKDYLNSHASTLKDAICLYRAIAYEQYFTLPRSTWEFLMRTISEVQEVLLSNPNQASRNMQYSASFKLLEYFSETLMVIWIRSKTSSEEFWKLLLKSLKLSVNIPEYISSWTAVMSKLSHVVHVKVYDMDLGETVMEGQESSVRAGKGNRRNLNSQKNATVTSVNIPLITSDMVGSNKTTKETGSSFVSTKGPEKVLKESVQTDMGEQPFSLSRNQSPLNFFRDRSTSNNPASGIELSKERATVENHVTYNHSVGFSSFHDLSSWNSENALSIWKNMLCAIGRIDEITVPHVHYTAITCVVQLWDQLLKLRQMQRFDNVNMPSLFDFASILFKATMMPTEYEQSVAIAAGCICRMMCRRHDQNFSPDFWLHFYTMLYKLLKPTVPSKIIYSILRNSDRIFALGLPGAYLLVPTFLSCINQVSPSAPDEVKNSCLLILSSLLCTQSYFQEISRVKANKPTNVPNIMHGLYDFTDLKPQLQTLGSQIAMNNKKDASLLFKEIALWNLSISLLDHLLNSNQVNNEWAHNALDTILEHISSPEVRVARAAVDGISLLLACFKDLKLIQESINAIIDRLVIAIFENLEFDDRTRVDPTSVKTAATIIQIHFRCLTECLMTAPSSVISHPNIALRISEVIEETLHISSSGISAILDEFSLKKDDSDTETPGSQSERRESISVDGKTGLAYYRHLKTTAEHFLSHLLHHVDNFPPKLGAATMNALIQDPTADDKDDKEADAYHIFALNETVIFTFIDLPQTESCRIVMRDASGKYAWNFTPFYRGLEEVENPAGLLRSKNGTVQRQASLGHIPSTDALKFLEPRVGLNRTVETQSTRAFETDSFTESRSFQEHDPLEQLLLRIGNDFPDCLRLTETGQLNTPSKALLDELGNIADITQAVDQLIKYEIEHEQNGDDVPKSKDTVSKAGIPARPEQPVETPSVYHTARLLLTHLGYLSFDYLKDGSFFMLNNSPALIRDLKGLDKKYSREAIKVALIYVAPGQEDEHSIFRNSCGSKEYESFVSALGWEVDLEKHAGYAGGLEKSMVNGGKITYFCTSSLEMVFHDITRMPTDPADPKQLKKKRHIGNDHVHIIWNEHFRDYKWDTIGGDFGNAQICITPLHNGLYAIDTYRDEFVRPFGPLQTRMLVPRSLLGPTVRTTAIHAYRAAMFAGQGDLYIEPHAYTHRKETIATITSRHRIHNATYEKVVDAIFLDPSQLTIPSSPLMSSSALPTSPA